MMGRTGMMSWPYHMLYDRCILGMNVTFLPVIVPSPEQRANARSFCFSCASEEAVLRDGRMLVVDAYFH